ncbi:MAG: helix-turn-helix domain-containing protein [Devosia sp.]|nr:helix-turn-helix domain-containing protein [Devosia sp.]
MSNSTKTALAMRVEERMKHLGLSQAEVARRGRFSRAFVSDILIGRKSDLRDQNYGKLAQALQTTVAFLRTGTPPSPEELAFLDLDDLPGTPSGQDPIRSRTAEELSRDRASRIEPLEALRHMPEWGDGFAIPLYRSEGRYDGAAVIRNPAFEVIRGPQPKSMQGWYGIAIPDSTMSPRYEAGDIIYAVQDALAHPRDFVVVRVLKRVGAAWSQVGYVRQLLRRTADEIVVRQLNPNQEISFKTSAFLFVDRIILSGEVLDARIL